MPNPIIAIHHWLSSEPKSEHYKQLCSVVTWGLLNVSGILLFGLVVAPSLYLLGIHNVAIAEIGAAALLVFVNIVFLIVKIFLGIWEVKTEMIYYYPFMALLSVPFVLFFVTPWVWSEHRQIKEFFKE